MVKWVRQKFRYFFRNITKLGHNNFLEFLESALYDRETHVKINNKGEKKIHELLINVK